MANTKILLATGSLLLALAGFVVATGFLSSGNRSLPAPTSDPLLAKIHAETFSPPSLAPELSLKDSSGNEFSLQDYRGKVILLTFWASWCPSCRHEMPVIQRLHQRLASEGLMIVGVNLREPSNVVEAFLREHELSFPTLLDEAGRAFESYDVWFVPTTFIIDKHGRILGKVVGNREWESEQGLAVLRALLTEST